MSATHYVQTAIEILLVVAGIAGIIYEPIIAKWEQKQGAKMLKAFKKMKECRK